MFFTRGIENAKIQAETQKILLENKQLENELARQPSYFQKNVALGSFVLALVAVGTLLLNL